ncbi:hypothetical protein TIFTF001_039278 [Ficus carica]|uniref:Uncharacterized protein n=1 Tax=Ficus carica TaxID=3494 RepID=A0AA88JAV5_FICCA|nr:hypothetical protein TIFTF001_039278 [Ficus carica]
MDAVCVFVNYNGQWDGTSSSYVGDEMKGILVPDNSTYVGLVELVRSVIGIRGPDKNIVMRYSVEPGLPLVRIQCDADVKFYIQLKKKDVHVVSKFPVTIDVLDESAAEAMPPEVGASNHIDVQRSRDGGQSDEAMQHVNDSNTIIPPPLQFPSPTVVNHVYPDAAFGICVQHLVANLKTRYKDFKGPLKTYFDGASRSYLLSEFHRHLESIRGLNPDMHRYLVETDPTKWSRAYFNGRRYAIMTTNIAESFNNMDRKARLMPVGFLVEWLRALLQRWFVERREEALKITSKLAPKAEKLI